MAPHAFLDRPRIPAQTSAGRIALPVVYTDATAIHAFFRLEHRRAAELLAPTPLQPVRFAGGVAIAAVVAYDYRETSIGPYREVGVALAVVPRGVAAPLLPLVHLLRAPAHHDVGWHVVDLPVTTAIADVGGRELWGFPKFVTDIDLELARRELSAVVQAPTGEEPILTLDGRAGPGVTLQATDLVLYTLRDGVLLRTVVEARGRMHTGTGGGLTLRVGDVGHPMARRLAALGLEGARPVAAQVCRFYYAVLDAGVPFRAGSALAA